MSYVSDTRTLEQIVVDICNELRKKDIGLTNFSTGSVIRAIVDCVANEVEMANANLDGLNAGFNLDSRVGEELDFIGDMLGIYRKDPTRAMGQVTFYTGDSPATRTITIPQGYIVSSRIVSEDDESYEFETVSACTIASGSYSTTVTVRAVETGAVTIPVGNLDTLTTTVIGVNSCMNETAIISGSGVQSDDDYRARIRANRKSIGTYSFLKEKIEEVEGVKKAYIVDDSTTAGKVNITTSYNTTDQTYISTTIIPAVTNAILEYKPVGVQYTLASPTYHTLALTISTSATLTSAQQSAVSTILSAYVGDIDPKGTFYNARAEQLINNELSKYNIYGLVYLGGLRTDYTDTEGKLLSPTYTFTVISNE